MSHSTKDAGIYAFIILILVFINAVILKLAYLKNEQWYGVLLITLPLLLLAVYRHKTASTSRASRRVPFRAPRARAVMPAGSKIN